MLTSTTSSSSELTAIGALTGDDDGTVDVRLVVPVDVRRVGRGRIALSLRMPDLAIEGAELIWLVTTNKGWAHMRGKASLVGGTELPFRADLFAASQIHDPGPDRFALRVYAEGEDPNRASPICKLSGAMPAGSIRV
jgi:hypothetical protein